MNVLGIGGYSHDSAAALVRDGQLIAAVAEERLTRVKHQGGPPVKAVQYCLDAAGLRIEDIHHVGAYMRPGLRLARRLPYRVTQMPKAPLYSLGYMGYEIAHNAQYVADMRRIAGPHAQLHYLDHHPAHAASSFLVSPFESAALLSIDYIGEMTATWFGVGEGLDIEALHEIRYPHSLGVFYSAITDYLGFQRASDEYKVMGLASYGAPEAFDAMREIIRQRDPDGYDFDLSYMAYQYRPGSRTGYFNERFYRKFGPPRKPGEPIEDRHKIIAASAQKILEETVLTLCRWLHTTTGKTDLCLAGGVALNCSMNGRIRRESPFNRVFVQPAAGDDGIAIGGAFRLYYDHSDAGRDYVMRDARLGPEFSDAAIREALELAKIRHEQPEDIVERTADLLADGKIVGWFQGRMEFGPRALGARSILADPTRADMQDLINKYVKHREEFRPFAPSVTRERAGEFFQGCNESPFMLFVYPVKLSARDRLPAITHVDGTARVQRVDRDVMPEYYR
ncbi:MAG: carbamoyltransferase N-terminal domain-containing protein, partial [Candidatus Hydrogenedentales bacterium]